MKSATMLFRILVTTASAVTIGRAAVTQPPEPFDPNPINGETYYLINQLSGMQVDLNGKSLANGDALIQRSRSFSSLTQRWAMTKAPSGNWKISNIYNGLCLDSASMGTTITVQNPCAINAPTQEWSFTYTGNGYNAILNADSKLALDVQGGSKNDGAALVQSAIIGSPTQSQLWMFRPVFWRGDDMSLGEKEEVDRVLHNTNSIPWWHDAYNPGQDLLQIFKNNGLNSIRLRPASINTTIVYGNNSFSMTAAPYNNYVLTAGTSTTFPLAAVTQIIPASVSTGNAGAGGNDAQTDWSAVDLCHRAKVLGMACFLCLFYNGSNGEVPQLWNGKTIAQLSGIPPTPGGACGTPGSCLMYNYVYQEIELFRANGAMPDMVALGNEVNDGLFQSFGTFSLSPTGTNATPNTAGTPNASFANFAAVQIPAMQAILDASADTSIGPAIPAPLRCIDPDGNPWLQTFFTTAVQYYGIPVDNVCASYYPGWHGPMTQAAHDWHATGPNTTSGQIWEANVDTEASGLQIPIYNGEDGVAYTNSGSPLDPWYGSSLTPSSASRAKQRQYYIDQTRVEKNEPNNLGMGMDCWACEATTITGATSINGFYTNGYLGLFDMTTTTGNPIVNAVLPDMLGLGGKVDPMLSYVFVNAANGRVLETTDASTSPGAALRTGLLTGVAGPHQLWQILAQDGNAELNSAIYPAPLDHLGDGYFQVVNMNQTNGVNVLDTNGAAAAGSLAVQNPQAVSPDAITGNANQEWDIMTAGNCGDIPANCATPPLTTTGNYYTIINKATGMVLAAAGTGASATIQLQAPAAASNLDWVTPANQGQLWQILPAHITTVVPTAVSSISTTASGLIYSRVSKTFNGTITIQNTSGSTINGPFQIVFSLLSGGATLTNATDVFQGNPFVTVPAVASLMPGQSATVSIQFSAAPSAQITFKPVTYIGSL
jgi:arabinogalactan endo-1,4-beta-galactosidase